MNALRRYIINYVTCDDKTERIKLCDTGRRVLLLKACRMLVCSLAPHGGGALSKRATIAALTTPQPMARTLLF